MTTEEKVRGLATDPQRFFLFFFFSWMVPLPVDSHFTMIVSVQSCSLFVTCFLFSTMSLFLFMGRQYPCFTEEQHVYFVQYCDLFCVMFVVTGCKYFVHQFRVMPQSLSKEHVLFECLIMIAVQPNPLWLLHDHCSWPLCGTQAVHWEMEMYHLMMGGSSATAQ